MLQQQLERLVETNEMLRKRARAATKEMKAAVAEMEREAALERRKEEHSKGDEALHLKDQELELEKEEKHLFKLLVKEQQIHEDLMSVKSIILGKSMQTDALEEDAARMELNAKALRKENETLKNDVIPSLIDALLKEESTIGSNMSEIEARLRAELAEAKEQLRIERDRQLRHTSYVSEANEEEHALRIGNKDLQKLIKLVSSPVVPIESPNKPAKSEKKALNQRENLLQNLRAKIEKLKTKHSSRMKILWQRNELLERLEEILRTGLTTCNQRRTSSYDV